MRYIPLVPTQACLAPLPEPRGAGQTPSLLGHQAHGPQEPAPVPAPPQWACSGPAPRSRSGSGSGSDAGLPVGPSILRPRPCGSRGCSFVSPVAFAADQPGPDASMKRRVKREEAPDSRAWKRREDGGSRGGRREGAVRRVQQPPVRREQEARPHPRPPPLLAGRSRHQGVVARGRELKAHLPGRHWSSGRPAGIAGLALGGGRSG